MMKTCETCVNNPWLPDGRLGTITKVCLECRHATPEEPSNWTPKPKTNADRIRAMSDEELEVFLINVDLDKDMPFTTDWGKWLKQPAQEDQ